MKLLLVGATGLVGSHALRLALDDSRITQVTSPVRRALPLAHHKLRAPIVDYEALPTDADWWQVDAVICALGTTMKVAGSEAAFHRVDHDYPLAVARLAHHHGTPTYVLNSATGADANSRFFYNKVKGELERDLAEVGFSSLAYARAGLIGGARTESRPMERVAISVLGALGPVLPRRLRVCPPQNIARVMIESAIQARPGVHIIPSTAMTQ
ncbi:NAD-dependent dehydratase [Ottowia thiooxydans]|uniref:NAD-dependent dehydratase n=1 Tax=Ottowia thiooxydans TaxID=219182 RepID=UPI0004055BFC|nr:NAD-dependent dehydratase [Ottowia thiooxydans]